MANANTCRRPNDNWLLFGSQSQKFGAPYGAFAYIKLLPCLSATLHGNRQSWLPENCVTETAQIQVTTMDRYVQTPNLMAFLALRLHLE